MKAPLPSEDRIRLSALIAASRTVLPWGLAQREGPMVLSPAERRILLGVFREIERTLSYH